MTENLLRGIGLLAFVLVEIMAIGMFFIVRYHFRTFGAPDDARSFTIVRIFGAGLTFLTVLAAWALLALW